ncbi:MAG: hypothetical protein KA105_01480 [Caulobacter sp.]|jgi:hypothetical protein|nr:hypothetical protein [Caulobacter sp.]
MRNSFLAAGVAAALAASPAMARAQDSSYAQASGESAEAVAALAEAGVKTVSGVVAVPVMVAGAGSVAVGSVAEGLGDSAQVVGSETVDAGSEAANFATTPLTLTDQVVTKPQPAPQAPYQARPAGKPQ